MSYLKNGTLLTSLIILIYLFYMSLISQNEPEVIVAPNLPSFSNEQVNHASIIVESFGRTGCPYCLILKENLYSNLFHPDSDRSNLAARYYNIKNQNVKSYFNEWLEKFNLPENLKGAVPATIINGTYLLLGYSEESTTFYLNVLDQISKGERVEENPDQYLFLIKEEHKKPVKTPIYFLTPTLLPLNLSLMTYSVLLSLHYSLKPKSLLNNIHLQKKVTSKI